MRYIELVYRVQRMIDGRACLWVPEVVGLARVGGGNLGPIGKIVRCPGYREVWPCTTRVVRICQKCGCNWRGTAEDNNIHCLNKMSAQSGSQWDATLR